MHEDSWDYTVLADELRAKPLPTFREARSLYGKSNNIKREMAVIAYGYAHIVRSDPHQLALFYREKFCIKRSYKPNVRFILLHCLQYLSDGGREAGAHARAMKPAFESGVPFDRVLLMLKTGGGFAGLMKARAQKTSEIDIECGGQQEADGQNFAQERTSLDLAASSTKLTNSAFEQIFKNYLLIPLDSERLNQALRANSITKLEVRALPSTGEFIDIEVINFG